VNLITGTLVSLLIRSRNQPPHETVNR